LLSAVGISEDEYQSFSSIWLGDAQRLVESLSRGAAGAKARGLLGAASGTTEEAAEKHSDSGKSGRKHPSGASMRRLVVSSRFCFCFFIHGVFVFAFVVAVVFCLSRQIHLGLLYALAGSRSGLGA
jgi:hypothetical protein